MSTPITIIDKQTLQHLRKEIQDALENLNERYNIKIIVGNGSYRASNAKIQLLVNTIGKDGTIKTKESTDYIQETFLNSWLKPEWLYQSFTFKAETYKIIGYLKRASKRPILTERKDGQQYNFDTASVIRYMGNK